MARTVLDDDIRNERIVLVGDYVKKNKASTRKASEFFTKYYFDISNATVSDYITRFSKMKNAEITKIKERLQDGYKKSLKDKKILERVIKAGELFSSGYDVEYISEKLKEDIKDIYSDINNRLIYANKKLYEEVKVLIDGASKKKNGK